MLDRFDERQVAADALPAGDAAAASCTRSTRSPCSTRRRRAALTAGTTIEEEEAEHGDR
jgi:hypothetical protein